MTKTRPNELLKTISTALKELRSIEASFVWLVTWQDEDEGRESPGVITPISWNRIAEVVPDPAGFPTLGFDAWLDVSTNRGGFYIRTRGGSDYDPVEASLSKERKIEKYLEYGVSGTFFFSQQEAQEWAKKSYNDLVEEGVVKK